MSALQLTTLTLWFETHQGSRYVVTPCRNINRRENIHMNDLSTVFKTARFMFQRAGV